jgi:hypothetical protein
MTTQILIDQYVTQQRELNKDKSDFDKRIVDMVLAGCVEILRLGICSLVTVKGEDGVERLVMRESRREQCKSN